MILININKARKLRCTRCSEFDLESRLIAEEDGSQGHTGAATVYWQAFKPEQIKLFHGIRFSQLY